MVKGKYPFQKYRLFLSFGGYFGINYTASTIDAEGGGGKLAGLSMTRRYDLLFLILQRLQDRAAETLAKILAVVLGGTAHVEPWHHFTISSTSGG